MAPPVAGTRPRIRLGSSACLLGRPVRYDGTSRLDPFLTETLGGRVEWVEVCPEVECGLPVPREPMHLVGDPGRPRLVTRRTRIDHTRRMRRWIRRRLEELAGEGLWGFVLKGKSPSCGLRRVPLFDEAGKRRAFGTGLFARAFARRFPLVPIEESERLRDPDVRKDFLARISALAGLRDLLAADRTAAGLAAFHAAHQTLIVAHSPSLCGRLGRLVAGAGKRRAEALSAGYARLFAEAMAVPVRRARHVRHA